MAERYNGDDIEQDGTRIRNMRVISDDKTLIHNMALAPEPIGTVEVIDGQFYRVMDNKQVTIVTQAPFTPTRECDVCGKPMMEGYYDGDCLSGHPNLEYYCSRECMATVMPLEKWDELYDENGDSFWTEWED